MEDTELLAFLDYIGKENDRIQKELKHYFELEQERERAGMNLYGIGTPRDQRNLEKWRSVYQLQYQAMRLSNFSELVDFVEQQLNSELDTESRKHYEREKEILIEFQKSKEATTPHHK